MADFGASYGEMQAMAAKLEDARDDITGQLESLQALVEDLIDDGFKTQHASSKFGRGYGELTSGLKTAIEGIGDMGRSLRRMMRAIEELDENLAG